MNVRRRLLPTLLRWLYGTKINGLPHVQRRDAGYLVIANHPGLVAEWVQLCLMTEQQGKPWLVMMHEPQWPRWKRGLLRWLFSPWLSLVIVAPVDKPVKDKPVKELKNGVSLSEAGSRLEQYLKQGGRAVVFPLGRVDENRAGRKYYAWSLLAAQRAEVVVLAAHLDRVPGCRITASIPGAIRSTVLVVAPQPVLFNPASSFQADSQSKGGGERIQIRQMAAQWAEDRLGEAALAAAIGRYTLWQRLCRTVRQHGRKRVALTDTTGKQATYGQLLTRSLIVGGWLQQQTEEGSYVGLLLPTTVTTMTVFFALHAYGRIPAMLNFSSGAGPVSSSCRSAKIKTVYTSRQFVRKAALEPIVQALQEHATVLYLEDLLKYLNFWRLLKAWFLAWFPEKAYQHLTHGITPDQAAVVLFTSGSEGNPKGVVLSHDNVLANAVQIHSRIDVTSEDTMLNVLPMFHAFGLTVGSLFPLFSGIRTHCLPSPLEYSLIPEQAYAQRATLLAGTDVFLRGYGRSADVSDFSFMRYVFAGAEPLRSETRDLWMKRFGIRVLEGYGTTETSPVLAVNTPMANQFGSVGRLLPGIEYRLQPVPGVRDGALLCVRGANIMLGYLTTGGDHRYHFPESPYGEGWYSSGDIVTMDTQGFVTIVGRARRFAKIAGEMISLAAVENLAAATWPEYQHAVVCQSDPRKGELLLLLTEHPKPNREALLQQAQSQGLQGFYVPKKLVTVATFPLLGSGKIDYSALTILVKSRNSTGS